MASVLAFPYSPPHFFLAALPFFFLSISKFYFTYFFLSFLAALLDKQVTPSEKHKLFYDCVRIASPGGAQLHLNLKSGEMPWGD